MFGPEAQLPYHACRSRSRDGRRTTDWRPTTFVTWQRGSLIRRDRLDSSNHFVDGYTFIHLSTRTSYLKTRPRMFFCASECDNGSNQLVAIAHCSLGITAHRPCRFQNFRNSVRKGINREIYRYASCLPRDLRPS